MLNCANNMLKHTGNMLIQVIDMLKQNIASNILKHAKTKNIAKNMLKHKILLKTC